MKQEIDLSREPLSPLTPADTDTQPADQTLIPKSLFGAFPEFAILREEDFLWAKHLPYNRPL